VSRCRGRCPGASDSGRAQPRRQSLNRAKVGSRGIRSGGDGTSLAGGQALGGLPQKSDSDSVVATRRSDAEPYSAPVPHGSFEVVDVTKWDIVDEETGGAEEKIWLRGPEDGERWLFKPVTVKEGRTYGDDWAEKAASELANRFGIPCARVELAKRGTDVGVISLNLKPHGYDLQEGAIVLAATAAPGYLPGQPSGRPGHNLTNIARVLDGLGHPPGAYVPVSFTAFDVFCGFLMFDAWVANADRHDQNWAVLRHQTDARMDRLCGAYDQANSLGYNVSPALRDACLVDQGRLGKWVAKGWARRFEYTPGSPRRTLVDHAATAFERTSEGVRDYWLARLTSITPSEERDLLAKIPRMSDPDRTFAGRVLDINRKRLLHACR
jgi:hypothetical protein